MSVYGRGDYGVHFPSFDDLRSGTPQTENIRNVQLGYRVQTPTLYADVESSVVLSRACPSSSS